jgi:hypothetical protein
MKRPGEGEKRDGPFTPPWKNIPRRAKDPTGRRAYCGSGNGASRHSWSPPALAEVRRGAPRAAKPPERRAPAPQAGPGRLGRDRTARHRSGSTGPEWRPMGIKVPPNCVQGGSIGHRRASVPVPPAGRSRGPGQGRGALYTSRTMAREMKLVPIQRHLEVHLGEVTEFCVGPYVRSGPSLGLHPPLWPCLPARSTRCCWTLAIGASVWRSPGEPLASCCFSPDRSFPGPVATCPSSGCEPTMGSAWRGSWPAPCSRPPGPGCWRR